MPTGDCPLGIPRIIWKKQFQIASEWLDRPIKQQGRRCFVCFTRSIFIKLANKAVYLNLVSPSSSCEQLRIRSSSGWNSVIVKIMLCCDGTTSFAYSCYIAVTPLPQELHSRWLLQLEIFSEQLRVLKDLQKLISIFFL